MKKILVPTDFSSQATYALQTAARIAAAHQSELYLLHTVQLPVHLTTAPPENLPEALFFLKLAEKQFEEFTAQPYLEGIPIHEIVLIDDPSSGIGRAVKEHQVDLIVMGSGGASGLKEIFIGSNTEKVIRTSEIPVLVIKKDMGAFKMDNFVFASDFSAETFDAYRKALAFARYFNAKIHLLYVNTPDNFETTPSIQQKMEVFTAELSPGDYTFTIFSDRTVEEGILNFAGTVHADVLGLVTHGRKGLAHFFNGSISEDLANHAMLPVVTFKMV